jgi:hypothetical protein
MLLARKLLSSQPVWISRSLRRLIIDNSDGDDSGGNNIGARRTNSTAGNRSNPNTAGSNNDMDCSSRKGNIRSSPDRTRYLSKLEHQNVSSLQPLNPQPRLRLTEVSSYFTSSH